MLKIFCFSLGIFYSSVFCAEIINRSVQEIYPINPGQSLMLYHTHGDIDIQAGEPDLVDISADIQVLARSMQRAADFLARVEVRADISDSAIAVFLHFPEHRGDKPLDWLFGKNRPDISADFRLAVPDTAPLDISVIRGTIFIRDYGGSCYLKTMQGSIVAENLYGPCVAETASGDITIQGLKRKARLTTAGGTITLTLPPDAALTLNVLQAHQGLRIDDQSLIPGEHGLIKHLNGGGPEIMMHAGLGGIQIYFEEMPKQP